MPIFSSSMMTVADGRILRPSNTLTFLMAIRFGGGRVTFQYSIRECGAGTERPELI